MLKKTRKYSISLLLLLLFVHPIAAAEETLPQNGDRILLTFSDGTALSAEAGRIGLLGKDFDPDAPEEELIWRAWLQADGSWILENDGNRLSLAAQTLGLTLNGAYDRWHLSVTGETVTLSNAHSGWYLTWYPGPEVFGASENVSEFSALQLCRLIEEVPAPSTEPPAEPSTEPPTEPPTEPVPPSTEEPEPPDTEEWQLYFGQLHAHTADSDGVGSVGEAYAQAARAGLDFFAVTDHSDSFDRDKEGLLTDGHISANWTAGKAAAAEATSESFVAIYGFEMSWNRGQGHISTFNTPGFLSRDLEDYRDYKDGMEAYFEALREVAASVSQFNHPGTIYGDFKAFSGYVPELDPVICLIEVGSGAGKEYQTAYDAYIRALDAGWHLAPTNNHNNHEGDFGTADTGRTVILAKTLTEESLYAAMRARRVYASEDSDLRIYFTLDGAVMGSRLRASQVGDRAEVHVNLFDPTDEALGTVEVIGPGGRVAASAEAAEMLTFSLPGNADYYFIRVTQPDGDIAVTAPVWIRQKDRIGISVFCPQTDLTRAGEEQTLCLTLFNREEEPLIIRSATLTEGGNLLAAVGESVLEGYSTVAFTFPHTFETEGVKHLRARVLAEFAGEEVVLEQELMLSVLPMAVTGDVLMDATHGGATDFGEFIALAATKNLSVRREREMLTASQLENCDLLVIPAPAMAFEPEFLELIFNYVNQGGNLLLLGGESGSEELNRLLESLGSSLRLNGDTLRDDVSNEGNPAHLYTGKIAPSDLTAGILEGQTFAHMEGCSISGGQWLVKSEAGHVLLATEGQILLSGSDFLADPLLKKTENPWALAFANRTIAENLLDITRTPPTVAPIGEVRKAGAGGIFLVEGLVTAGTHNKNTDFPGSIYIQDATGALEAEGYSDPGLELGRRVRILGRLDQREGRPLLQILQTEILEKENPLLPESAEGPDYATMGDELLLVEGTVTEVLWEDGIQSFVLLNEAGREVTVWVEDYILSGSLGYNHLERFVKAGNRVSAVGLCHLRQGNTVLRLRDCDEVKLLWEPPEPTAPPETESTTAQETDPPDTEPATEETPSTTEAPTTAPAPPAYPDNPPTGDRVSPPGLLLVMALCCVLMGIVMKKGCP